jgi:hypothetical protein
VVVSLKSWEHASQHFILEIEIELTPYSINLPPQQYLIRRISGIYFNTAITHGLQYFMKHNFSHLANLTCPRFLCVTCSFSKSKHSAANSHTPSSSSIKPLNLASILIPLLQSLSTMMALNPFRLPVLTAQANQTMIAKANATFSIERQHHAHLTTAKAGYGEIATLKSGENDDFTVFISSKIRADSEVTTKIESAGKRGGEASLGVRGPSPKAVVALPTRRT